MSRPRGHPSCQCGHAPYVRGHVTDRCGQVSVPLGRVRRRGLRAHGRDRSRAPRTLSGARRTPRTDPSGTVRDPGPSRTAQATSARHRASARVPVQGHVARHWWHPPERQWAATRAIGLCRACSGIPPGSGRPTCRGAGCAGPRRGPAAAPFWTSITACATSPPIGSCRIRSRSRDREERPSFPGYRCLPSPTAWASAASAAVRGPAVRRSGSRCPAGI